MDKQEELDFLRDWTTTLIKLAKDVMSTGNDVLFLEVIEGTYKKRILEGCVPFMMTLMRALPVKDRKLREGGIKC